MTPPQIVVFDLGKVLLDFDYSVAAKRLAGRGAASVEQIHRFINQSPLLHRYETGLMTTEEFYGQVKSETGFQGDLREFTALFSDIFQPIPAMIELHAALRQRGIPNYILSNTNPLAIAHIRSTYPFFHNFDGYVFSHEHGAMKPHEKLYQVVETMTGRNRDQILFMDDREENVAAAAARGWQVILHETTEKTSAVLKRFGWVD